VYSSTLSLTLGLDGGWWLRARPGRFTQRISPVWIEQYADDEDGGDGDGDDDSSNTILIFKLPSLTAHWPIVKPQQHKCRKNYIKTHARIQKQHKKQISFITDSSFKLNI
jgi:hypothetical protein